MREHRKDVESRSEKRKVKMTRRDDSREELRRRNRWIFAEALTVLILNKEVKLIRFI